MTQPDYWAGAGLPNDQREKIRQQAIRYSEFIPGIGPDGNVPDEAAAAALLEFINLAADLSDEYIYWLQLSNDVMEAYADWLSATRRKFERRGWPWTVEELARRSHLWEHE